MSDDISPKLFMPNEFEKFVLPNHAPLTAHISRAHAERLDPSSMERNGRSTRIISINEPFSPDGDATLSGNWDSKLVMRFCDVTDEKIESSITDGMAEDIAEFISDNYRSNIFVHCRAGVSRSAAIARLLSECGWEAAPGSFFQHANILVYNKVKKFLIPKLEKLGSFQKFIKEKLEQRK